MSRLFRQAAALAVAYSIALQGLLLGVVLGTHAGVDPFTVICGNDAGGDHNGPPQQNGNDCGACFLACFHGSPALMPSSSNFVSMLSANQTAPLAPWATARPLPAKHQPQAARAPPLQG